MEAELYQRSPGPVEEDAVPLPDEAPPPTDDSLLRLEPPPPSPWFSVFWLMIALVALWGIATGLSTLVELWQRHLALAILLGIAGALLTVLLTRAMWQEWLAMRDVDQLARRQSQMDDALASNDISTLQLALEPTITSLRKRNPELIEEFEAAAVDIHDCDDYLKAFENIVLHILDARASQLVKNGAVATATAVAIVPHPAFDAVVVLWRSLVMTREIGAVYGLRPGGLASWRLFTYAIKSALLAASVEALTAVATDAVANASLRLVKPVAESAVIGVRVYRFGRLAIAMCRPLNQIP
jgi:uncharacterized membrane protein YcjF (UPF0283 family)